MIKLNSYLWLNKESINVLSTLELKTVKSCKTEDQLYSTLLEVYTIKIKNYKYIIKTLKTNSIFIDTNIIVFESFLEQLEDYKELIIYRYKYFKSLEV